MTTIRWSDPFRDFVHLQERINRAFTDGPSGEAPAAAGVWAPPVDIYETGDHEVVLTVELPAMKREDIEILVDNGTLTIKGEKRLEPDVPAGPGIKAEQFHRVERRYGPFGRSFSLPHAVDTGKVAADYRDGVLTIRLPMREEARARQVKIDVAA